MKIYLILLLSTILSHASFGQKRFKTYFYPTSITVNNVVQENDTIYTRLKANQTSRVIIWENEQNKISVLYKVRANKRKVKTKSRVEIFVNGK